MEKRTKEEELKNMKREAEVWKYINKKRGVRKWNENDIGKKEWRRHFIGIVGGRGDGSKSEEREEEIRRSIEEEIEER